MNAVGEAGADRPALDVVLVQMPFSHIARPSISLGILKASLAGTGTRCAVDYANLHFVEAVGPEVFAIAASTRTETLLGEWIFASAAFPQKRSTLGEFLAVLRCRRLRREGMLALRERNRSDFDAVFTHLRDYATAFIDETARRLLAHRPRIIGCSSMFEQHCASLALLRRVKELDPTVVTLIGGANCEAEMGIATLRLCPWVDFAVSGEADDLFPVLCGMLLADGLAVDPAALPVGVLSGAETRGRPRGVGRERAPRAMLAALDRSPIPDYFDYFAALDVSPLRDRITPGLPVETSRGCWWGEKSRCTFCGLNGHGVAYRSKSPERVLRELDTLASRHRVDRFEMVDNIVDLAYLRTALPELAARGAPYRLFYETKANLKRAQVALLKGAGVSVIQPGIEALHDRSLRLIGKGSSAVANVQVLKYTREQGIFCSWLMLFGFPGEDDAWHAEVAAWLPAIFHLQPPFTTLGVRFDRFSTYHQEPERFGLDLVPAPAYAALYPASADVLADLAYFFVDTHTPDAESELSPGIAAVVRQVVAWRGLYAGTVRPVLSEDDDGAAIRFYDTRPCAAERRFRIDGLTAEVYRACEPAIPRRELERRYGAEPLGLALAELERRRLVLALRDRVLALGISGDVPPLLPAAEFPGGSVDFGGVPAEETIRRVAQALREREGAGAVSAAEDGAAVFRRCAVGESWAEEAP